MNKDGQDLSDIRRAMVRCQLVPRGISDGRVLEAMERVASEQWATM